MSIFLTQPLSSLSLFSSTLLSLCSTLLSNSLRSALYFCSFLVHSVVVLELSAPGGKHIRVAPAHLVEGFRLQHIVPVGSYTSGGFRRTRLRIIFILWQRFLSNVPDTPFANSLICPYIEFAVFRVELIHPIPRLPPPWATPVSYMGGPTHWISLPPRGTSPEPYLERYPVRPTGETSTCCPRNTRKGACIRGIHCYPIITSGASYRPFANRYHAGPTTCFTRAARPAGNSQVARQMERRSRFPCSHSRSSLKRRR